MRYKWGLKSIKKIKSCDCRIQKLMKKVIETAPFDITVLEGFRPQEVQDEYYSRGRTKPGKIITWTKKSNHTEIPSKAIDLAPYPIAWKDLAAFEVLGAHVLKCAKELNISIEWGGNWKGKKKDSPHYQLRRIK